jgi:integrase
MALNAKQVENLARRRLRGRFGAGEGLYLQVTEKGASWLFRFKLNGRPRMMGLGAYPEVSLAEARGRSLKMRAATHIGVDPLEEKHANRRVARQTRMAAAANPTQPTFRDAAEAYIAAHRTGWRNPKHAQQWANTLATYVYPKIGDVPVDALTLDHVLAVLQPIWHAKTETASRVRGRIELVLDAARARGWRSAENPARWRGNLAMWLPVRTRVTKVEHHAALDWRQVPAIIPVLAARPGMAALALRFLILTAVRSGDVRGATWAEIDENYGFPLWVIPVQRMKVQQGQRGRLDDHRVPLSDAALAILEEVRARPQPDNPAALVFPALSGKPLSDMTLTALLRRLGWTDAAGKTITAHGFRSSFRDWAGESTAHPREVIEAALAHRIKDKAEAAYARGDLLVKRRALMNDWADFCTRAPATVTELAGRKAVRLPLVLNGATEVTASVS